MNILYIIIFTIHIGIAVIINKNFIDNFKFDFFPYLSTILLLSINHIIIAYLVIDILPKGILYMILFLVIHLILLLIVLKSNIKIFYLNWFETVEKGHQRISIFRKSVLVNVLLLINSLWLLFILVYFNFLVSVERFFLLVLVAFSICFYILLLFYFAAIIKCHIISIESITDKNYRREVERYLKVIRSQRHDFNFHLHAISGMIDNRNIHECQQYIKTMVHESNHLNDIIGIHDPAIAAMLNIFRENALINRINIDFDIRYNMENIGCSSYETNKIIGNLLQNALDETERHKDLSYGVKVLIFKRSGNTIIDISNIFKGEHKIFENVFQKGYSTKVNHEGIGLSAISNIIELREGIIYTEIEDNIVHFIVSIPNRYAKIKN